MEGPVQRKIIYIYLLAAPVQRIFWRRRPAQTSGAQLRPIQEGEGRLSDAMFIVDEDEPPQMSWPIVTSLPRRRRTQEAFPEPSANRGGEARALCCPVAGKVFVQTLR